MVDFDVFHIVAQMVWRGEIEQAYHFATMLEAQRAASGTESFMPWTYPPQFDLIIAPLAFLPRGLAYGLFTAVTLVAYLATLRRIAGEHLPLTLIVLFPAIAITIACGQNGFLTGTLIGLTCLGLQSNRRLAGLTLGLMVIKPHLAIAFATYTLLSRRWGMAALAGSVVIATSILATILFGMDIWAAVLAGAKEARVYLEHGMYPLFRMVSIYAALYTLGLPATAAFGAQLLVVAISLAMIVYAVYHRMQLRQVLGLTAIASLLISPYAYDYDLPIYGIGFALLVPDLLRLAKENERLTLYGLTLVTGLFGLVETFRLETLYGSHAAEAIIAGRPGSLSIAGLTLAALLGLCWYILRRDRSSKLNMGDTVQRSASAT
ncbi:glycosyltransferase family 87 protein [Microvirga vignae]|uniref:glycosyltransferase family 87 protein n=1 Tax=Microvirga vignae TaxID=1225564 RepID=UPI0013649C4D|nr:glycosyltransferase family 87 protein [Microvirga vignae]